MSVCIVTTCLNNVENLEMSENYIDVRDVLGILVKVRELLGKKY